MFWVDFSLTVLQAHAQTTHHPASNEPFWKKQNGKKQKAQKKPSPERDVSLGSCAAWRMASPKSVALSGESGRLVKKRKLSGLTSR